MIAARALQPAAFGRLALVLSVGAVIGVLTEGGLPLLVVDAIGRDPAVAPSVVRAALRIRMVLTAGGALVLSLVGLAIGQPLAAVWYGVAMMGSAVVTTIGPALRATGRVIPESMAEGSGRVTVVLVGVLFLQFHATPAAVAAAYAVGLGGAATGLVVYARSLVFGQGGADAARPWPVSWRRAAPLSVAAAMVTLYNRLDLWLLALLATSRAAGLYAAVYRVFEGLVLPSTALGSLLLPAAVGQASARRRRLALRYGLAGAGLAGVGAIATIAGAPQLINGLLGHEFGSGVTAMRLLAAASVPTAFFTAVSPLASVLDRRGCVHLVAVAMVASVIANIVLIPVLGVTGAGVGMVLSQTLLAVLFWRQLNRVGD